MRISGYARSARRIGDLDAGGRHLGDLCGRLLAALGELAHLGGHDREAPAVLARARGLDGGVEREQVGLAGDLLDDLDVLGDLLHLADGAATRPRHWLRPIRGPVGDLLGVGGALGVLADARTISSMDAETSSAEAACSFDPCESCWEPWRLRRALGHAVRDALDLQTVARRRSAIDRSRRPARRSRRCCALGTPVRLPSAIVLGPEGLGDGNVMTG